MAEAAIREATYADLEAVPAHLVAEIIDGVLEAQPRPRPRHGAATSRFAGAIEPPFGRGRDGPGDWIFILDPVERVLEAFGFSGRHWLTNQPGEKVAVAPFDAAPFPLDDLFTFRRSALA